MSGMRIKGFQLVPAKRSIQLNETEVLMLALTAISSTTAVKVPIPVHMQLAGL